MEAFPTGRFPSSWKLSPQLAQSDEVATASGGEKCWTIDESNLDAARVIMKEIYGYADNELMKRSHSKFM